MISFSIYHPLADHLGRHLEIGSRHAGLDLTYFAPLRIDCQCHPQSAGHLQAEMKDGTGFDNDDDDESATSSGSDDAMDESGGPGPAAAPNGVPSSSGTQGHSPNAAQMDSDGFQVVQTRRRTRSQGPP